MYTQVADAKGCLLLVLSGIRSAHTLFVRGVSVEKDALCARPFNTDWNVHHCLQCQVAECPTISYFVPCTDISTLSVLNIQTAFADYFAVCDALRPDVDGRLAAASCCLFVC